MKRLKWNSQSLLPLPFALFFIFPQVILSQEIKTSRTEKNDLKVFSLNNDLVCLQVVISGKKLEGDSLSGDPAWLKSFGSDPFTLFSDGGFGLKMVWTDWSAPGKINNAENPVVLDKSCFEITEDRFVQSEDQITELQLSFKGIDVPIQIKIIYQLEPGAFFFKRKLILQDTVYGYHFLDGINVYKSNIYGLMKSGMKESSTMREESSAINTSLRKSTGEMLKLSVPTIQKPGGFGQPVAVRYTQTSAFFGLEYPASDNLAKVTGDGGIHVECSQEFGTRLGKMPVESEWVVEALVPTLFAKDWFFKYLDRIRVAPAKPYTLYNSWYDLRSPEYPKVQPVNVMNEQNVLNIIRLFKKNMIEKHHIQLDGFVLDDGWDIYQSDWLLRKETFPNGLKPLSDTLKKMGTNLGIWFGPTGGYSFRMKRVDWMKEHGYEVVGKGRNYAMLCLAGKNYSELFKKRVTDFTANDGIGYYKWDGIQFSCSEPDHGHPVGIFSRRAVMESVIDKCKAVRAINPKAYLNITSGTWLSPWWVKYANQIWMQGADYGYADVPSIHARDAAMTYKDFVLYDDFRNNDLWFPVSNLMTHGIIKGNLERLGGDDDPIDKFTNDVVFYLARGISMYELYISPDLLNDAEWDAIGTAVTWAKDRQYLLSETYMVGGDPTNKESYGFVHFKGNRGIIAVRNPYITPSMITVTLSEEYGMWPDVSNLVLEKVYPYRWISAQLYSSGTTIEIPLEGYETAVFEIYPLKEANEPLISGAKFNVDGISENHYKVSVYNSPLEIRLLNPEKVKDAYSGGSPVNPYQISFDNPLPKVMLSEIKAESKKVKDGLELQTNLSFDPSVKEARFAMLLKPEKNFANKDFPQVDFIVDGKITQATVEQQKGLWSFYSKVISNSVKEIVVKVISRSKTDEWKGNASIFLICHQQEKAKEIEFTTTEKISLRQMPPQPFLGGISQKTIHLGEFILDVH